MTMNGSLLLTVAGAMLAILIGGAAANWHNHVTPISRADWCAAHPTSNLHGAVLIAHGQVCDD